MSKWKGGSGDWATGDWKGGVPDSSAASATIAASGDYTITISATDTTFEIETVGSALLNAAGATLQIAGLLQIAKSFKDLDGVIALAGGSIENLNPSGSSIYLGIGAKVVDTDSGDNRFSPGGQLMASTVVNWGQIDAGLTGSRGIDVGAKFTNNGTVLVTNGDSFGTVGVSATNRHAVVVTDGGVDWNGKNLGSISSTALGNIGFEGANSGTIISDGGVDGFDNLSNTGKVTATNAMVEFSGTLSNTGKGAIAISASTVTLNGTFSSTLMALFDKQDDTISIGSEGVVNNKGQTLAIGKGSGFSTIALSGEISGGVIADAGSGLIFEGDPNDSTMALLNAVHYEGVLDLSGASAMLGVSDGLTLTTPHGGDGKAELTGDDSQLVFDGKQTFNNAQIDIGNADASEDQLSVLQGGVLTLGAKLTIIDTASQSIVDLDTYVPSGGGDVVSRPSSEPSTVGEIVNQGAIEAEGAGGTLRIAPDIFTNNGSILVGNGDTLDLQPGTSFTNLAGTTLTGGPYTVEAASTLQLSHGAEIVTDDADITLSGLGSVIQSFDSTTDAEVGLEATLAQIGAHGSLDLLDGCDFAASGDLSNAGKLTIEGATFSATTLANAAGGTISLVDTSPTARAILHVGALDNDGKINVAGGVSSVSFGFDVDDLAR